MTNLEEKMKEKKKKKKEAMAKLRSDSPTCRRIVLAFLDFLDSVQPSAGVDFEGLGVSKDCLEHVFKINAGAFSDEIQPGMLIDMFSSREHAEGCKLKSVLGTSPLESTCARSSSPRVEASSGLKNEASDLGQDPIAQPALSGNSSSSFNSLSSASLLTEFFPNKYGAPTQPAGSTNHSAPPPYVVSTPVGIASQSRTVASHRHHRRLFVGNSEEPSEPEIRIASSNTGLHHEQIWTRRSTGPSNHRISTRVLPVGNLIPPSIRSIYRTALESTEQMNSSTQSTSSSSIPADVVNFFRTMHTASPSHQGHDSTPNGNQEASVGTLIYRTALESTEQMNSSTQSTSSSSIPADVVNFFRTMHTASPSHQGHDSTPNGNQEASVGTLIPPSFRSIYGTTLQSTGQMNSNTQSTSSPSVPADVVNFFRTMYTASPSHHGHDSIPNGNQEASVGTRIPPSFTSIYGTTLESTGQMNSSTQSTSSPSIPADVVNFFRNMYTSSQSHQGHDSGPNGNQEASGKTNRCTQSTSSPSAISADFANLLRIKATTYQNHHGHESRPNGDQKVSGQRNGSMYITSSPIAVPPDVVNWFETMCATPHSHHNDQSKPNGNQEASGQTNGGRYTTSSPITVPPDVANWFGTMPTASLSHHGHQSRPNGNQEASGELESQRQRNSSRYITSSPIPVPPDVVNWFETMYATPHSHHNDQSRPTGNQEASGQRSSNMHTTSSPVTVPPDVVNWFKTMSATSHSHHDDQSRPNGNQEASGSDRT